MGILQERMFSSPSGVVAVLVSSVFFSIGVFSGIEMIATELPFVRELFRTGAQPSAAVEAALRRESSDHLVVLEAVNRVPLRESPPRTSGLLPLQKAPEIASIEPRSEWIVLDSVNLKKITGDDTWVLVANKEDASRVLPKSASAYPDKVRAFLGHNTNVSMQPVRTGWAYLGKNFILDRDNR